MSPITTIATGEGDSPRSCVRGGGCVVGPAGRERRKEDRRPAAGKP